MSVLVSLQQLEKAHLKLSDYLGERNKRKSLGLLLIREPFAVLVDVKEDGHDRIESLYVADSRIQSSIGKKRTEQSVSPCPLATSHYVSQRWLKRRGWYRCCRCRRHIDVGRASRVAASWWLEAELWRIGRGRLWRSLGSALERSLALSLLRQLQSLPVRVPGEVDRTAEGCAEPCELREGAMYVRLNLVQEAIVANGSATRGHGSWKLLKTLSALGDKRVVGRKRLLRLRALEQHEPCQPTQRARLIRHACEQLSDSEWSCKGIEIGLAHRQKQADGAPRARAPVSSSLRRQAQTPCRRHP